MMDAALDFQEMLFEAQSQGGSTRQRHLRQADAALNKLRLYLRLAHRWHWPRRLRFAFGPSLRRSQSRAHQRHIRRM